MGKKTYFEFLEEAFQSLTAEVQKGLTRQHQLREGSGGVAEAEDLFVIGHVDDEEDNDSNHNHNQQAASPEILLPKLFARCRVIFKKMYTEAHGDAEFQERLGLYKIQLQALVQHYRETNPDDPNKSYRKIQETTFTFNETDWTV